MIHNIMKKTKLNFIGLYLKYQNMKIQTNLMF